MDSQGVLGCARLCSRALHSSVLRKAGRETPYGILSSCRPRMTAVARPLDISYMCPFKAYLKKLAPMGFARQIVGATTHLRALNSKPKLHTNLCGMVAADAKRVAQGGHELPGWSHLMVSDDAWPRPSSDDGRQFGTDPEPLVTIEAEAPPPEEDENEVPDD
eukprot:4407873-Amphidinium_carterae.1